MIFGINNRTHYAVCSTSNALGAVAYEEQATGSNGFGQRLAVRNYENFAVDLFPTGGDQLTLFNGGRVVVNSVSGGYTMASIAAGTHDTEWNAAFDRMLALDFGGTDTSGAGTKKPLVAPLCLFHEVDVPTHNVPAADYIAAFKHIRVLRNARAAAAGKDPLTVPLMTIFTAYGINVGRAQQYWPGNDQVDIFGIDGYSGLNGGKWTEASNVFGGSLTFSTAHGDKNVWICETSVKAETGHDTTVWWQNYAAFVNSHPKIKAVLAFCGAPGDQVVNFDKSCWPAKHLGMADFITATGATAGYGAAGGTTQLPPSAPTGVTFTSDPSGLFGTVTWAANPSGDNVTLWDAFKAPGKVTSGFTKINATSLPAAPRSYQVTGLTAGSPYTFTVVAINSAGRSGFGNMFQTVTSLPGPTNLAPTILSFSADVDTTDSTLVHFTSSASDPNGDPLTYTIAVAGANGFTQTLTGPNVDANFDPGAYQASLSVSDGTLTTTQVVPFQIVVLPLVTVNYGWRLLQPGDDLRDTTEVQRQTYPDIDARIAASAPLPGIGLNPLTGMYHLGGNGGIIGSDLASALATSDALDAILTAITPTGSGRIWVEPDVTGYYLARSHAVIRSGVQIEGFGGFPSGLPSSKFTAHASGDFTNGVMTDSVMFKPDTARASGLPPNVWHHNWRIHGVALFGNSVVDTAILTYRNGESSSIRDVYVTGCNSDGVISEGGQARLNWELNSSGNGGHGVHFKKWYQGMGVALISGDGNAGKLVQITEGSVNADPAHLSLHFKAESNTSSSQHDAVIGLDSCHAQFSLTATGTALTVGGTDVVRIDTPSSGGPSVTLVAEGTNLFNTGYTNLIRDTSGGAAPPVVAPTAAPFTATVYWNRKVLVGGTSTVQTGIATVVPRQAIIPVFSQPNVLTQGTWAYSANAAAVNNALGFNNSATLNDEFRWQAALAPGNYTLDGIAVKTSNGGIGTFDLSFDGGTTWSGGTLGKALGTFDFYAGANTYNQNLTSSGAGWTAAPGKTFTLTKDTLVLLRLRMLSKNASSTAYQAALSALFLTGTV